MASRASVASSSFHPWEIRDQLFQAKRSGDNARAKGPASSSSLQQHNETDTADARNGTSAITAHSGQSADNPNLPRGLAPEVKQRMIEMFAQFQSVSRVHDAIKSEFGLSLDHRTVESFNPDSMRCRIGKRLRSLFDQQRKAYISECAKQGVAHQAHRLRLIGQLVEKAEKSKDYAAALKGLELAAKEMGGLSQTVKHEGVVSHVHGTVEEARRELALKLKEMVPQLDCHVTEKTLEPMRHVTEDSDNAASANVPPMPDAALVTSTLPIPDDDGQGGDTDA